VIERHFETRVEAMAFVARILSDLDGIPYESAEDEDFARDRRSLMIVPEDRASVATSPHLPPPIWKEAVGFPSDAEIEDFLSTLADLPAPAIQGIPFAANWGWSRPDLIRYNRVEGPAIGGRLEASVGGPYTLAGTGYFGFADLDPKVRLDVERSGVLRRVKLGAYRELRPTNTRGRHLGFGNSMYAFLFGRDEGEYFRATGADLVIRPPAGARESFEWRMYAERHEAVGNEIGFAVVRTFDSGWDFRPNVVADERDEVGAELRLSPWRGGDPLRAQIGLDLYGQGARSRPTSGPGAVADYARASAVLRVAAPIVYPTWRLGFEVGGGTSWGDAPAQRAWFLGGGSTLRGYPASAASGSTFGRARVEVARTFDAIGTLSLFGDAGWAGERDAFDVGDTLYGIGIGGSLLDGLVRFDLSHGLYGPARQFRVDLYLDGLL
jgi:hypothetical protein